MNKKKLREDTTRNVYIYEDLTPLRSSLLYYVKKVSGVKFAYTRDGKIMVVMNDDHKVYIESPDDLFRLGQNSIDYKVLGIEHLAFGDR